MLTAQVKLSAGIKDNLKNLARCLVFVGLTVSLTACGQSPGTGGQAATAQPPSVEVSQPIQRDIVEWDEYTGRLQAAESVEAKARV